MSSKPSTLQKIKQNLCWALGYDGVMIPLASLGPSARAGGGRDGRVFGFGARQSLTFRTCTPDEDYGLLGFRSQ